NAFANRARQSVVAPVAGAGFLVRRDVRRHEPGHLLVRPHMTRTLAARHRRRAGFRPVRIRVTAKAALYTLDEIFTARHALRGRFKLAIGKRALLCADERAPANCKSDAQNDQGDEYEQSDCGKLLPASGQCFSPPVTFKSDLI